VTLRHVFWRADMGRWIEVTPQGLVPVSPTESLRILAPQDGRVYHVDAKGVAIPLAESNNE
jgi:hypothetical protein